MESTKYFGDIIKKILHSYGKRNPDEDGSKNICYWLNSGDIRLRRYERFGEIKNRVYFEKEIVYEDDDSDEIPRIVVYSKGSWEDFFKQR